MKKEIWKQVLDYQGFYKVSNYGIVKSVDRFILNGGIKRFRKGKIIKTHINKYGYELCYLSKNGKTKTISVHKIVASSFLGKNNLQVDHLNSIKTDNNILNLEYVTNRENVARYFNKKKTSSKYTGVVKLKNTGHFVATIRFNGKRENLGYFKNEETASIAYKNALENIKNGSFISYKTKKSSKYVGVYYIRKNKWRSVIIRNKKRIDLGYFNSETKAFEAYKNKDMEIKHGIIK